MGFRVSKKNGVLITLILTIAAMLIVYSMEFTVSASSDESLEAAINNYNFTTDIDVDVLAKEEAGKYLFVVYSQVDHEGWGGITRLERGILGKYRFKDCNNTNWQLYNAKGLELGRNNYLLIYGLNDLSVVSHFTVEDENEVIVFQADAYTGPFIELIGTETLLNVSNRSIRYYDDTGAEVSMKTLWDQFHVSDTGDGASVGSAEQGIIYALLGVILAIGLLTARSFWKSDTKKEAN